MAWISERNSPRSLPTSCSEWTGWLAPKPPRRSSGPGCPVSSSATAGRAYEVAPPTKIDSSPTSSGSSSAWARQPGPHRPASRCSSTSCRMLRRPHSPRSAQRSIVRAQDVTPVTLVAAGLPTLPGRLADAKSYAERLFTYPELGPLTEQASRAAIVEAISGITLPDGGTPSVEDDALDRIVAFADGYPMFLQSAGQAFLGRGGQSCHHPPGRPDRRGRRLQGAVDRPLPITLATSDASSARLPGGFGGGRRPRPKRRHCRGRRIQGPWSRWGGARRAHREGHRVSTPARRDRVHGAAVRSLRPRTRGSSR